ncbi:MAG TPA: 3'(2'),5'-bisphosphate nucleotidase CysQ [Terriglobia bacterium]|nr:3'(2'),5'-bisphosphate nucleotidase CysQ [Terriglobia bacterium]
MPESFSQELEAAKEIAVAAGAILLEHYAGAPVVEWKGVGDPVTSADRAASGFISAELKRRFPGDFILSEEESDSMERLSRPRVWIVDPMDGTKEFIARVGEFAVMIGLSVGGRPVVGAVYDPTNATLYFAAAGQGAFVSDGRETRPMRVNGESDPARARIALSRSHPSIRVDRVRRRMNIRNSIQRGSIGLKIALICEGKAHLYLHINDHTSQWDTCAPDAILREAGGRLTDTDGAALTYNRRETRNLRGVVATNGVIHDRVVKALQEERALEKK